MFWPGPSVVSQRPAHLPCCAPGRPRACLRPACPARLACAPRSLSLRVMSLVQWLYCNTALPISLAPVSQYSELYCDTILQLGSPPWSRYNPLYYDTSPAIPACNTIVVLQYNFSSQLHLSCNTNSILQYNFPPSQYNLGSSQFPISAPNFFFRFFFHFHLFFSLYIYIYIYIYIYSNYFQQLEKS